VHLPQGTDLAPGAEIDLFATAHSLLEPRP
jgi:hypothetical protein